MKIAVVTGYLGFIGVHLTNKLLEKGYLVYGIDSEEKTANTSFKSIFVKGYPDSFKHITCKIQNLVELPDCDIIFNLAAESDVDTSNNNSYEFIQTNIAGVEKLLSIITKTPLVKHYRPRLIHISTDEVYGSFIGDSPYTEDKALAPGNPYAASKAAADLLINSWDTTHCLDYNIVRPTNAFGTQQYPEKLIPLTVKNIKRGKKIKLHNQGSPIRTWTYVDDIVSGIILVAEQGVNKEVYNISSEIEYNNLEIVKAIQTGLAIHTDPSSLDLSFDRPGQDMRYCISSNKIRELGWKANNTDVLKLVERLAIRYWNDVRW